VAFMASGGYKGIGAQVPNVKVRSATCSCWLCSGHSVSVLA
jgi:hypothetical protein